MKRIHLLLILFVVLTTACGTLTTADRSKSIINKRYANSIEWAMSPSASKVYNDLIAIDGSNKKLIWKTIDGEQYLKVVTWKQDTTYYYKYLDSAFYNTKQYPIWITTAPELLERMKNERYKDANLRLKQLLGLPPNPDDNYIAFVEFWVRPQDLFRPCPDNEVTDKACQLCFPEKTDSIYKAWVDDNRISRYYGCELYSKYPWTQLGYTFDWNKRNRSHVGLSEFVIGTNKKVVVNAIYTTQEYLAKTEMD